MLKSKKRFRFGKDANKMLKKKLIKNFILHGKLVTTEKKIKFIIPDIEKIITLAKKNTQSSKNEIFKKIEDKKIVEIIYNNIISVFKNRNSGYLKHYKLNNRLSDGALISKLEWVEPIVIEKKIKEKKEEKLKKSTEIKSKIKLSKNK